VSFLRRLFAFLSKGNKANDVEVPPAPPPPATASDEEVAKTAGTDDELSAEAPVDEEVASEEVLPASSSIDSEPSGPTDVPISPPITAPTPGQSEQKDDDPVGTGDTLIDWSKPKIEDNITDINISKPIPPDTPKAVSPTPTYQPSLETIKQPKVTSHNTMKICPKTGEHMKEIEVLGEKIDVSSAGCYFDRGELARILGSKPSFLQSVGNFLTGRGNPYEAADRGADVMMLQQDIQKSEARLRTLRLGSPEYDVEYTNLKSLNAKMQGLNR